MPTPLARLFGRGRARKSDDHAFGLRLAAALVETDQPLRVLASASRLARRVASCDVALIGLQRTPATAAAGYDWVAGGCRRCDRRLLQEALDGRHSPLVAVDDRPSWIKLSDDPFQPGAAMLRRFGLAWCLALPLWLAHSGQARRGALVLAGADPLVDQDHPLIRDARLVWLATREHLTAAARRLDPRADTPWPEAPAAWDEAPAAIALLGSDQVVALNRAARRLLAETLGDDGGRWQNWLVGAVRRLDVAGQTSEVLTASLSRNRSLAVTVGNAVTADGARLIALQPADPPGEHPAEQEAAMRMLGHELRTPLAAMQTSLDLVLRGDAGPLSADQQRFLGTSRRNLERLNRLLGDLLDARLSGASRQALQAETVDLGVLLRDELDMLAVVCREKGLRLEAEDLPASFRACVDADKVQQMLHNVVGNAIKYTASGGTVRVSLQDRLDASAGPSRSAGPLLARRFDLPLDVFTLAVQDTGLGMSADFLATIFQPFHREDRVETRRLPGAGLGLHITRGLVEAHGGLIRVESRPGLGTTVWLVLPREPASGQVLNVGRELEALNRRARTAGLDVAVAALDLRQRCAASQPWEIEALDVHLRTFLSRLGRECRDARAQRFAEAAGQLGWQLAPGLWCGLVLDPQRLAVAWQVVIAAPERHHLLADSRWQPLPEFDESKATPAPPQPRADDPQPEVVGV